MALKIKSKLFFSCIFRRILLLLSAALLGVLFLCLAFLLPVENMFQHVKESSVLLSKEGFYPVKWGDEIGSTLDNFTDALMIQNATYPSSGNPLKDAMQVNHLQFTGDMRPITDLENQISNPSAGVGYEYARYWHGYLIFLKPLLLIFSYQQIRILNMVLQVFLFVFLLWTMKKASLQTYILPLCVSWLGIAPWVLPYSMQLSSMYYLALLGVIILLRYYETLIKYKYYYFMLLGILTAYFDYLTWPVITLGLPLVFYTLKEISAKDLKTILREIFGLCINWAIGYGAMWSLKWVFGELILQDGTFSKAVGAALYRSSKEAEGIVVSFFLVWRRTIGRLLNPAFLAAAMIYVIHLILSTFKKRRSSLKQSWNLTASLPFFLIAVIPLLWYAATRNHSYIHLSLVYRSLWISVFSGFCAAILFLRQSK